MSQHNELPPVVSSEEQYISELKRIPRLSVAEQRTLEALAREGDEQAKERLIKECMHYVAKSASYYAFYYQQEYLDLVQVGNLALVEHIDLALTAKVPTSYLCGVARGEIKSHCLYRARLITLPESTVYLQQGRPMVSLDENLSKGRELAASDDPLAQVIEDLEPEEKTSFDALYGALDEALTANQREVVMRHYGLGDYAPESLAEIGRQVTSGTKRTGRVYLHHSEALKRLRDYFKRA